MPLYADIVLPLAQPAYTFAVPEGMHVEAGQAVAVQFGARKFYTGIVWRVHDRRPPFKTVKSIQRVLYGAPLLSAQQMAFWEWVAAYYMCTPGEVMRVGLPSLMKPSGDTEEEFTEEEFRPRTECYVALAPGLHDEGRLHEAFEKLERRAPRQYEALLELASAGDGERIPTGEVARRLLRADYAVLHALERKGYIVSAERERTVERGGSAFRLPELTPAALDAAKPVVDACPAGEKNLPVRWAALLHDVGKPPCFSLGPDGVGHFYGHAAKSTELAEGILTRLRFDTAGRTRITQLIRYHDLPIAPEAKPIRRLMNKLGVETVRQLFELHIADTCGQSAICAGRVETYRQAERVLDELLAADACFSLKDLAVNGDDLLALGLRGRAVGAALQACLDAVMDETLPNDRAALLGYAAENLQRFANS